MTPIKSHRMARWSVVILLVVIALLVESTVAREGSATRDGSAASDGSATRSQVTGPGRARKSPSSGTDTRNSRRLREGTIISDQTGYFREDGDGATFISDEGWEFGALPNLNLERVVRLLKNADQPSSIRWSVTGKVTEFSGRNFLLISRAVYKSTAPASRARSHRLRELKC